MSSKYSTAGNLPLFQIFTFQENTNSYITLQNKTVILKMYFHSEPSQALNKEQTATVQLCIQNSEGVFSVFRFSY